MISRQLSCFKAYDVRGRVGFDLDEDVAYRIGRAMAQVLNAKRLAVGCDIRLSSPALKAAMTEGMRDAGCDVLDLGLTGTEEIYYASMSLDIDGGVQVTASHNPKDYNGFKFVGAKGKPLKLDEEFKTLQRIAESAMEPPVAQRGRLEAISNLAPYVDYLMQQVDITKFKATRIVVDAGNGAAGRVIDAIEQRFIRHNIPVTFIKINHHPDGNFPNGVPNPLLPENRALTSAAVRSHKADLGIAWDGDFDRCFFYDENGTYVSGYYVAGLLSAQAVAREAGAAIIVDSRLNWNTYDLVKAAGGHAYPSRTGHIFFKDVMRQHNGVYGGEISAHHYFRCFGYCDSGMLPWLMMLDYLSTKGTTLAASVAERIKLFPSSDEINFKVSDPPGAVQKLTEHFRPKATGIDTLDGVTIEMGDLRFNLRASNTEHMLRLNVESLGDQQAVDRCIADITAFVAAMNDKPLVH